MTDHCPKCGSANISLEYGGERGEAGPFIVCRVCGYDGETDRGTDLAQRQIASILLFRDGVRAAIQAQDAGRAATAAAAELSEAAGSLSIKAWLLSQAMQRKFLAGSETPPTGAELEAAACRVSRAMKAVSDEAKTRRIDRFKI